MAPADACPSCGSGLRPLGEDVAEQLEYMPASFRVIRHVRPKMACQCCDVIVQAPAPSRPIERSIAGPGLLAHVLVAKFADHLPLYRQSVIYARDGVDLDRALLASWVGAASALLETAAFADPIPLPEPLVLPLEMLAIPYAFARRFGVVLQAHEGSHAAIAMRAGSDPKVLLELRRHLARPFDVEFVAAEEFDRLLSDRYAMDGQAAAVAAGTLGLGDELDMLAGDLPTADDLLDTADDAPAIRLINGIIADAARNGVSDIHVEPYESGLVVRMRIDGVLRETLRMPPHVAPVVVSRIKVMARLDIAERRVPQDGRIGLTLGGKLLDVRVSTLPSRAGSEERRVGKECPVLCRSRWSPYH